MGPESILAAGFAVMFVTATLGFSMLALRLWRWRVPRARRPRSLPKHRVAWEDEAAYEKLVTELYQEVRQAINGGDLETLEVVAPGAFEFFKPRMHWTDRREMLQGTVRESWDEAAQTLVVTLALTRWAGGWKRFYERWKLERRGKGWFVVEARLAKLD